MLLHPDKNINKSDSEKTAIAEQYSLCQIKLDKVTEALNVFNKQGLAGNCSGRTAYDKKCDQVIVTWMIETDYNEADAVETWNAKEALNKRRETIKQKNELTSFDQCSDLYRTGRNQTNYWRLAVYNAVHS